MPKYNVHFQTVASCTVTVEADNKDDARDKAQEELPSGPCAYCSGYGPGVPHSLDYGDFEFIDDVSGYDETWGPTVELADG